MYKSPIDMLVTDIQHQTASQQDEEIYKAVCHFVPNVDKGELLRALKYDRNQYTKGYADGLREAVEQLEAEVESSDKYIREYDDSEVQIAYNSGLRQALKVIKEMTGEGREGE
ncbi:MAG: hypothetical protein IKW20_05255 [Bacteroidales bacterium]|nr:hypothetical protein [Bacteroidales bacterium]